MSGAGNVAPAPRTDTGAAEVVAAMVAVAIVTGLDALVMLRVLLVIIWYPKPPAITAIIMTAIITNRPTFRFADWLDNSITN